MQRRHCGLVFRLVLLMSITTVTTAAGQWTDTYDVSGPYSGPTQFGGTRNQDWVRNKNPSDNPVIGSGSAIPLTFQQMIDKAAPYPDRFLADGYNLLWTMKVGDYYVGGSSVNIVVTPEGNQLPVIRAFVGKNGDLRTSVTNPNFASGDYGHTDYVVKDLNSLGQVLLAPYGGGSSVYNYESDTKIELPPLVAGIGSKVEAMGIDETGAVVGSSSFVDGSGTTIKHAFIYRGSVMTDLNDLVQLSDGKYLNYATDLTDTGEIIANMVDPAKPGWINWVKLTPTTTVPEPSSLLIGFLGIAAATWKFGKRRNSIQNL